MRKSNRNSNRKPRHYKKEVVSKSIFDDNPTLITYQYLVPKPYVSAVQNVIETYKSGTPFNKAVDQVSLLYSNTINRNKLAEHTLKYIANDY